MRIAAIQFDVIPFATTKQGSYWIPSEPGLWPVPPEADNVERISQITDRIPSFRRFTNEAENQLKSHLHSRLQQTLGFLERNEVDIAVFPEYCFPCDEETLELLNNFRNSMVVVAGIGIPRPTGIGLLKKYTDDEVDPFNNVVIVADRNNCQVVSKCESSEDEYFSPGTGPRLLEVRMRESSIKLGVSICKDYLAGGHYDPNLQDSDIIAIPALSNAVSPFLPDSPRDYPRIFANSSKGGGSTVVASGCQGVFATNNGIEAIPSGNEGIVAIDWHGPLTRPSSIRTKNSRTVLRGAIVSESSQILPGSNQNDDSNIAEILSQLDMISEADQLDRDAINTACRWSEYLGNFPNFAVLRDSVEEYRKALNNQLLHEDLLHTVKSHLRTGLESLSAMKKNLLERIAGEIDEELSLNLRNQAEHDTEKYRAILQIADSYADWRPGGEITTEATEDSSTIVPYFQVGFGWFDLEDAEATIAAQEDFLKSFFSAAPRGSKLSYLLWTSKNPTTDLVGAQFRLRFFGPKTRAASQYFNKLEPIVRSVFIRGWALYPPQETNITGYCVDILPVTETESRGSVEREDLGILVDALRAAGDASSIEMVAVPGRLSDNQSEITEIQLGVRVTTAEPDEALPNFVGSTLFPKGWSLTPTTEQNDITLVTVNSETGLSILHPPDGHIEGRGMSRRHELRISAPEELAVRNAGAFVGYASLARPDYDRQIELRIPNSSRTVHTYIIGRTGSGKTNSLKNIVRSDLLLNNAVVVIDPHGDLFDYSLKHVATQREFIALDFSREDIPSINPIYLDARTEDDISRNIDELVECLVVGSYHEFAGPRFRDLARLCLTTLVAVADEQNSNFASLADVPRLVEDSDFRGKTLSKLKLLHRDDLEMQWKAHNSIKLEERADLEQWFVSKFSDFRRSRSFSKAVSGRPTISLSKCLSEGYVVLIKVPTAGLGATSSKFLGSLLMERVLRFTVENGFAENSDPASLVVDEFQHFVGTSFERLIPEARKFNLGLTLANQNLNQLSGFSAYEGGRSSALLDVVLGNCGNYLIHSVGSVDAKTLADEVGVDSRRLMRMGRYQAVASLTVDGVRTAGFTVRLLDSRQYPGIVSENTVSTAVSEALKSAKRSVFIPNIDRSCADEKGDPGKAVDESSMTFLDKYLRDSKRRGNAAD